MSIDLFDYFDTDYGDDARTDDSLSSHPDHVDINSNGLGGHDVCHDGQRVGHMDDNIFLQ